MICKSCDGLGHSRTADQSGRLRSLRCESCKGTGNTPQEWLTTSQAADVLGVAPSTVYKWRVRGVGPPYTRTGERVIRYKYDDLK